MANHRSTVVTPIFTDFQIGGGGGGGDGNNASLLPRHNWRDGLRLWEIPPNGQGITALIALNILEQLSDVLITLRHNSTQYLHILIEAVRLAFADTLKHCADPEFAKVI